MPAARLFLAIRLGRSGRTDEAREQLTLLRDDFHAADFVLFAGFVIGVEGWLETMDGRYEEALPLMRLQADWATTPMSSTM